MVKVEMLGKKKMTKPKKGTLSPVFNNTFFLDFPNLKKDQLLDATIKFSVLDKNSVVISDTVIGAYELDITSVYFALHHELYHAWLTLTDPTDEREGIMGYIKVIISFLGPNDEPFVHDVTTERAVNTTLYFISICGLSF